MIACKLSELISCWGFVMFQLSIEEKIEIIAKKIYGADGIELEPLAQEQVDRYKRQVRTDSGDLCDCDGERESWPSE